MSFFVSRSFYWLQDICHFDLDHLLNWPLSHLFYKRILFSKVSNVHDFEPLCITVKNNA